MHLSLFCLHLPEMNSGLSWPKISLVQALKRRSSGFSRFLSYLNFYEVILSIFLTHFQPWNGVAGWLASQLYFKDFFGQNTLISKAYNPKSVMHCRSTCPCCIQHCHWPNQGYNTDIWFDETERFCKIKKSLHEFMYMQQNRLIA